MITMTKPISPEAVARQTASLGRKLTNEQARSLTIYLELLEKWNKKMNLVGPRDWQTMLATLMIDSWNLADVLQSLDLGDGFRTLDLGAGAGLPGIPLRVFWDQGEYILVESRQKLQTYHDRYKGKRCFVIGNGPSLKNTDLSKLSGEYTFGMNRIYLMFPELGFPTSFLVCVNDLVDLKKPSLSASRIATNATSGKSSPSRSKFTPTSTLKFPRRKSLSISTRSKVSTSECIYLVFMPRFIRYLVSSSAMRFVRVVTSILNFLSIVFSISSSKSSI